MIGTLPTWQRVWRGYLIWPGRVVIFQCEQTAAFLRRRIASFYYRAADRPFGGTRYSRYQDRLDAEIERMEEDLAAQKKKIAEMDEQLFAFEVLEQALTNPNFVVNDHIHQDR